MSSTLFITGATSGFGEACARRFAEAGWSLVLTGRREERLQALAGELSAKTRVLPLTLDVRDRAAMSAAVDNLPEEFATLRGLINNAGLALGTDPAQSCDLDDWDTMVDTNIKGLLYSTRLMSVEENLLMGTIPIGMDHAEEDMQRMFELFPRLKERRNQRAMTMSGGEQQMLAIARALMSRPKLLLLDEPSLGLAPIVVKQIFQTLRELARSGMTIFLVEQNANHALKLSDRAYVMVTGEIRMSGSGEELLGNQEVRNAYLGGH